MAAKDQPPPKSEAQVRKELNQLLEEIEALKEQARNHGRTFVSPSEEELARKIRRETAKSPGFYGWSWTSAVSSGGTGSVTANIRNFDPQSHSVFVTMYFGLGNLEPDITSALTTRDTQWPYVSSDFTFLPGNGTTAATFNFQPPSLDTDTHLGNLILWGPNLYGVGNLFDRALFWIKLI